MKYTLEFCLALAMAAAMLGGCGGNGGGSKTTTAPNPHQATGNTGTGTTNSGAGNSGSATNGLPAETLALGISAIPPALARTYTKALKFNRYTQVTAPNGKAIHIVAQALLTDEQIVRARSVLMHYLRDYPGSQYGADKSIVANKMADNNATLLLLNGSDDGTNAGANLDGQPLYQNEIQVEGHNWYIKQDYENHRDATFEEILHMVHDTGIGVDQNPSFQGALPEYQAEIRAAQVAALSDKRWGIGSPDWIAELTAENSLSQEYLAAVVDVYYGLWGAWTGSATHGMHGLYVAKSRAELVTDDPQGAKVMDNKFLHPYLTYNARIDPSFSGDFSLRFNKALAYSHHAQYLKDITLTGDKDANVVVNQRDNHITGNAGNNAVIFSGNSSQYSVETQSNGTTVVADGMENRDGRNTLQKIEKLIFVDGTQLIATP